MSAWERLGLARRWTDTFFLATPDGRIGTTSSPTAGPRRAGLRRLVEHLAEGLDVTLRHEVREVRVGDDGTPLVDGEPVRRRRPRDARPPGRGPAAAGPGPRSSASPAARGTPRCASGRPGRSGGGRRSTASSSTTPPSSPGSRTTAGGAATACRCSSPTRRRRSRRRGWTTSPPASSRCWRRCPPSWAPARCRTRSGSGCTGGRWPRRGLNRREAFGLTGSGIGVCGDAWGSRSRVEQAWLSGHLLGDELATRLGGRRPGLLRPLEYPPSRAAPHPVRYRRAPPEA